MEVPVVVLPHAAAFNSCVHERGPVRRLRDPVRTPRSPLFPLPLTRSRRYDTDNNGPATPQQLAFVNSFQPAFLALIASMPPGTGVFSPTCLAHCLSGQSTYSTLLVNGLSMNDAVTSWYSGDGQSSRVISDCQGWGCTAQCGVDPHGRPCNLGGSVKGCTAVSLPTSEPGEPAPATENAVQELPGSVAQTEAALSSEQQSGLQQMIGQQQQQGQQNGRRLTGLERAAQWAAAECTSCGRG